MFNAEEFVRRVEAGDVAVYRKVSEVERKPISWLWPGRIARGKVSMIAGDPGLGKSQLTASLAALVTTGGIWPVSSDASPMGDVIFLSAEDDVADTLGPRLEAAGADTSRVHVLEAVTEAVSGESRNFDLRDDIATLEDMMRKVGNVVLVVIDPISAYLGKTDDHKNGEVRSLLHHLSNLAARYNVAVVCISHQNKGGNGQKAMMRVMGSVAFVAAVRASFVVTKDKDNPDLRLLLPTKNNLSQDKVGFSFRIEPVTLLDGIETSRIVWDGETSISADEALSSDGGGSTQGGALQEAEEFLI